jgi:hypothetical protein
MIASGGVKEEGGMFFNWCVSLDFLEVLRDTRACYADLRKIELAIRRLKWVEDVYLHHMAVVTFNFETESAEVANRRLKERTQCLERILQRYGKPYQETTN